MREIRGNMSQREFSQKIGIHQNSLSQYETGLREPGAIVISKICSYFEINSSWLLAGEGAARQEAGKTEKSYSESEEKKDFVEIPIFDFAKESRKNNLSDSFEPKSTETVCTSQKRSGYSCVIPKGIPGGNFQWNGKTAGRFVFPEKYLRDVLKVEPNALFFTSVRGETMEPTLKPGEMVLIDRSQIKIDQGGIFLTQIDQELIFKRIQPLPRQVLEITGDNPAYKSFKINARRLSPGSGFALIGRVILSLRRF